MSSASVVVVVVSLSPLTFFAFHSATVAIATLTRFPSLSCSTGAIAIEAIATLA